MAKGPKTSPRGRDARPGLSRLKKGSRARAPCGGAGAEAGARRHEEEVEQVRQMALHRQESPVIFTPFRHGGGVASVSLDQPCLARGDPEVRSEPPEAASSAGCAIPHQSAFRYSVSPQQPSRECL